MLSQDSKNEKFASNVSVASQSCTKIFISILLILFFVTQRPLDIHHKSTTSTMASIASETKNEDIYVRGESDIFEYLNAQLKKRILILDGAMGTMIQKHRFTEEDVRINSILHYPL